MIVLGFSGRIGSGKNYVAELIQKNYDDVKIISFAEPLKKVAAELFGIPFEWTQTQEGKKKETWYQWEWIVSGKPGFMTVRDILQYLGTELVRDNLSPEHWVRLLENKIKIHQQDGTRILCVTDTRFINEATLINKYGTTVRVAGRNGGVDENHASEACLKTWDAHYSIWNDVNQTDATLLTQVDNILGDYRV